MADKIQNISNQAFDHIKEVGLSPTPEIYELWYVHYCGVNPDLSHALGLIVQNKEQKITDDVCMELYQQYLSDNANEKQVRQAGEKIQQTIKNVSTVVGDVKAATHNYNEDLRQKTASLSENTSPEELKSVLGDVMSNTSEMMVHNQKLEEQLLHSAQAISDMQHNLEAARKEALTDALTGVANRKAFEDEIKRIAQEAKDTGTAFSLLMLDIDHFKSFNDNFGHQVGDQVLRLVAKALVDGVKGRDIVCRYGGEEFAVILPETNVTGGIRVGDSLRVAVANKELVNRSTGEKLGRITLSGGVAEAINGEDIEAMIERSDNALYTAKNNGRNQIAAAT
jgi:diguanylate cyclase